MKKIFRAIFFASIILAGCTPPPTTPVVLKPGQIYVSSSDTIYSIAKCHDISVRELVETNGLTPPYILEEGQVLTLPSKSEAQDSSVPVDDLDSASGDPIALAEETWKDVPLNTSEDIESEVEVIPSPTLPAPESLQENISQKDAPEKSSAPSRKASFENKLAKPSEEVVSPVMGKKSSDHSSPPPSLEKKTKVLKNSNKKGNISKTGEFKPPVQNDLKCVLDKQTAVFHTSPKDPVVACKDGVVVYAGKCDQFHKDPALANKSFVFVSHTDAKGEKWSSVYLGIMPVVKKDQAVKQGEVLGKCQGGVLRFQLRKNRIPVNPKRYLK